MQTLKSICVSDRDAARLKAVLDEGLPRYGETLRKYAYALRAELGRAHVVPERDLPPDVVGLDSVVRITDLDTRSDMTFRLALPEDADRSDRVSVLSPLGMAVFGYRVGDRKDWGPVERLIRFRIDSVSSVQRRRERRGPALGRSLAGRRPRRRVRLRA